MACRLPSCLHLQCYTLVLPPHSGNSRAQPPQSPVREEDSPKPAGLGEVPPAGVGHGNRKQTSIMTCRMGRGHLSWIVGVRQDMHSCGQGAESYPWPELLALAFTFKSLSPSQRPVSPTFYHKHSLGASRMFFGCSAQTSSSWGQDPSRIRQISVMPAFLEPVGHPSVHTP